MRVQNGALAMVVLVGLAACGGSSVPVVVTEPDPFDAFLERRDAGVTLIENLPKFGTTHAAMPDSGSAQFSGAAGMIIDPVFETDADDVYVLGDVALTARFAGNGSVTGEITNMQGTQGTTRANSTFFDVGGRIAIGTNRSQIGNVPEDGLDPNQFLADYRGRITTPDDRYDISGFVVGRFLGTDPSRPQAPMKGLTANSVSGLSIDSDGDDAEVFLEIGATRN